MKDVSYSIYIYMGYLPYYSGLFQGRNFHEFHKIIRIRDTFGGDFNLTIWV